MRRPARHSQGQEQHSIEHSIEHTRSLPEEINAATKQTHTRLNRLILARLPLALPPHTNDPSTYAIGLLQFAPVYFVFESVWLALLKDPTLRHQRKWALRVEVEERTRMILERLYIPELLRTERLRQDLKMLLRLSHDGVEERMNRQDWPRLHAFTAHIESSVSTKPHLLIAYAWVLYMALFSGGRWMRAKILGAGANFWDESPHSGSDEKDKCGRGSSLSFLHFDGLQDGEDIKQDFKSRLSKAEALLTAEERQDIVREAQDIFRHCVLLVEELDDMMAIQKTTEPMSLPQLLLKHLLPMGMVDLLQGISR